MKKPYVYICSPYRAASAEQLEKNIALARRSSCMAMALRRIPIVPHLLFPQFLDESDEEQRKVGIEAGLTMLELAEELWVVGSTISEGMAKEIAKATELGIPIRILDDPKDASTKVVSEILKKEAK